MACSRCGNELPANSNAQTCPRCGAPRPDPSWTMPIAQGFEPTLESRKSRAGALDAGKKYALVVLKGHRAGDVIPLDKPRVVIGRADCDIVLKDPELSRQHALVAINGTSARLEDLGSTNGTFVDERRIEQAELCDRSEFRVGSHELLFVMRSAEELDG